ncbi:Hypothetical predicted protein [Paramuricea clavata]|uniref:Uncharacterized protein n=1 Tax=Paramuricea clavata TaxID=317549 RepID=A0A7D9DF73_PARCT|nr:Hypothetical predicted protein [Paramuricea clavata]
MMDVDEMFAIEEEVVMDPAESLAASLKKIEKKKEKKRKWRRRKRERLRNDERMVGDKNNGNEGLNINFKAQECSGTNMGLFESSTSTSMEIENSRASISGEIEGNLDRQSIENWLQSDLGNDLDNSSDDRLRMRLKAMECSTTNIGLLGSTASIDTENNERNSFAFGSDGLDETLDRRPKEDSSQNYLNSECFTMERKSKGCSTGLFESNVNIDTEDSELQIKKRERLREKGERTMNDEGDGKGLTMDIKENECSTTINPATITGLLESNISIVDENSGINSLKSNGGIADSLNCQANYAERDFTNDFGDENIENQSLRMGVKATEYSSTISNVELLESDVSMETDNSQISTKDISQSHDSIEKRSGQQQVDEDVRLDLKTDVDNVGKENVDSLSPKMDIQAKSLDFVNEKISVDNQESQKPLGHIETEGDVFVGYKDETLVEISTGGDQTQDSCSDGEDGSAKTSQSFRSGEEEGVVELLQEESDGKDLSTNDEGNKDDSFGEETTSNEVTIYGIMKEVKRTESELKEAGSLLSNDRNTNTYPYQPYSILQGNVLAMEVDEGSQDSVMFDWSLDREGAAMGVQAVTLHHKITYGEEIRGSMKQVCGIDSLVKAVGDGDGDSSGAIGEDGGGNAEGIGEDVGYDNYGSNSDDIEVDYVMTKVSEMDDDSCDGNNGNGGDGNNDSEYVGDTDESDGGNYEDVGYYGDSDGTIAIGGEMVDSATNKNDEKADFGGGSCEDNNVDADQLGDVNNGNGDKVDNIDDGEDGICDDGILDLSKGTNDHSNSHDGNYGSRAVEGTSHNHDDGTGNENDDGTSIVAHGKGTDNGAGSHDGDGSSNIGNGSNDGGDSVGGISIVKGTDNNPKEKSIDEGKLRSTVKGERDNGRDEEHSVAEKTVTEILTDVPQSGNREITKQENVEEKEEGELTSSSDDENLEKCGDSRKDKKKHKAGLEKVLAPKCDEKKSNVRLKSTGTTSKEIQGDGDKEKRKRRNSISCARERSSEIKEKISDEKRGQKSVKERRRSLVEKGIDHDDRSSKRATSKDKTEGRKISLSKERKSEKDHIKTINKRRSSSTSQKRNVTDIADKTGDSSPRIVESKDNAKSRKVSTSKGRKREKDNVKAIKERRSSSTSQKLNATDIGDNTDDSSSKTVESKDTAKSYKISTSKGREHEKDNVKAIKERRSSSTSQKRNATTDIGDNTDGSSSRTVENKDTAKSSKMSASKGREREKDNVQRIKERRSSSTSQKRNVTDIGDTDDSSSKTVENKDTAKCSKISTSKGRELGKDNDKTIKERRSSSTSQKRNVTDIGDNTGDSSSKTVESKDNAKSSKINTSKGRELEKDNVKTIKERRRSSTSEKRYVTEKEVDKDSSSRKIGTKENAENRKSLRILRKESRSKEDDNKTIGKKRNSTTVIKLDTSSSSRDLRSKDSLRKSKSITSSHDKRSDLNDYEKNVNKTANDNSLTKSESCAKQPKQMEKAKVSGDKNSREDQIRHNESGRRESRSSSESYTRNLSRNKEKESDDKHKTQIRKSGYNTSPVGSTCKRTTRQSSTSLKSSSKRLSKSSEELMNTSSETQSKGKSVEPIRNISKDSSKGSDGKNVREKSSVTEVRRSSRVSDKKKNIGDQEVTKKDSKREIPKTKAKTDAKKTTSGKKTDLVRHEDRSLKSQDNSSVKQEKGDACGTEKAAGKEENLEKNVKEKVTCKNEDFSLKSADKSTVKRKESGLMKYGNCGTGQTAGKKGSIKEDSLKKNVKENVTCSNNDNKLEPYKKGQSVSKKSDNERSDERKSARNAAKEKSFSRDEKPPEEQKKKLENDETDAKRTQKNINITRNISEECRNNKINTTKSLESGKEKICNSSEATQKKNNGSVKEKDGSLKTSESSKSRVAQKVKAETLTGKEAVAKKKLTVEEYKNKKRSESKDWLKNEANKTSKTVNDKSEKSTQPKTLKESEKLQQPRKSRSQKQIYKGDEEKLSRKRKREDTPVRPQKVRKTKNVDTNKESVKFVKTKEAKLPGNVVTVRILKVERGKALVLKRRHVNQLFIRGDNIIMVAHENVGTTEDKVVKTKVTAVPD